MALRLFSPTLTYRLFDPMPLPKVSRVREFKRLTVVKRVQPKPPRTFILKVKKIGVE